MPWINAFERRGLERGRQEGFSELLAAQLTKRFGALPPSVSERLQRASPEELQRWGVAVLDAPTLESVFQRS